VKTLRYYDETGLLKPVHVDPFTGYRLYEYSQLWVLHRTAGSASVALKHLGFSLEQIGRLLDDGLSVKQMRGMLKPSETDARQRVREEAERLERIGARLRQIEQEDCMSKYDVVIKSVDDVKVASVRDVVPTPPEQGGLWQELEEYLAQKRVRPTGACFRLYHDDEYKERDWDLEVCEPIDAELGETQRVKVQTLPAVKPWRARSTTDRLPRLGKPITPSANGSPITTIALWDRAERCICMRPKTSVRPIQTR
jgi:DNA-binding transcriptional MerR regulator